MAQQPTDYRIEEYKTLRVELLRNFDAMERNLLACITANGIAVAFGIKESELGILVIAVLIPVYFWIQHLNHRRAVAKLGAYIAFYLEGTSTGLMWEQRVARVDAPAIQRFSLSYSLRKVLLPYPVLVAVSGIILLSHLDLAPAGTPVLLRFLPATLLALAIWLVSIRADVSYAQLREPWNDAFRGISREEASREPAE